MVKLLKKSKSKKRWLGIINQPPFFKIRILHRKAYIKKNITAKPKRAKYYCVSLTRYRKLFITTRRFKTTKQNRTTKYKQLVIPVYFSSVKEIVISQKFSIPRGKKPLLDLRKARSSPGINTLACLPAGRVANGFSSLDVSSDTSPSDKTIFARVISPWIRSILRKSSITLISLLQKQIPVYTLLVFAGVCGTLYFGWQTIKKPDLQPTTTFSIPIPKANTSVIDKGLPRSEPNHITIPRIGIDTGIMTVGKNADGTMETPPVLEYITGWYKFGPTPGEIGPAIIVGHVDNYKGISVFWRLREVLPGDEISITRADGKIVKFKVDALKQFDQDNFPTQEVYGDVNRAELRLITCGGTFNKQTQHYTQNTVVFASITK